MESLSDIRHQAELALGDRSAYDVASEAGLPRNVIWRFLKGRHEPKAERLIEICAALGMEMNVGPRRSETTSGLPLELESSVQALSRIVSDAGGDPIPDDAWAVLALRHGAATPLAEGEDTGPGTEPVNVPQSPAHAGAGAGADEFDGEPAHRVWMSRGWMDRLGIVDPARCIAIKVDGPSMEPTLPHGSLVMIDRDRTEPREGGIYAAITADGLVVRRAVRLPSGTWWLKAEQTEAKCRPWPEDASVIGQAVWKGRHMVQLRAGRNVR